MMATMTIQVNFVFCTQLVFRKSVPGPNSNFSCHPSFSSKIGSDANPRKSIELGGITLKYILMQTNLPKTFNVRSVLRHFIPGFCYHLLFPEWKIRTPPATSSPCIHTYFFQLRQQKETIFYFILFFWMILPFRELFGLKIQIDYLKFRQR